MLFKNSRVGIKEVRLDLGELYPCLKDRVAFEKRLADFLPSHASHSSLFELSDDELLYRTECLVPRKHDARPPLLLLFGNPASHSVYSEMFFSFEEGKQEHRFWTALRKAGILSFPFEGDRSQDVGWAERNQQRKHALHQLCYESPFRIGFAVFYSMPSPPSITPWAGVAGLRRLFGKKAFERIGVIEGQRIGHLIRQFVSPNGAVIAFQKDAYLGTKLATDPDYTIVGAKSGKLVGKCRHAPGVRLFCCPPTRLLLAKRSLELLANLRECVLRTTELPGHSV